MFYLRKPKPVSRNWWNLFQCGFTCKIRNVKA